MIMTDGLRLGLHLFDGLYRPLFLIPAAIVFISIRVVSGSVRASVAAHMISNGFVFAVFSYLVFQRRSQKELKGQQYYTMRRFSWLSLPLSALG
jgi:hypothetical protein